MKPARILIVGINYSPELTGIGRFSGETGSWLSEQGNRVTVVTAHPYYPEWRTRGGWRAWLFRRETVDGVDVWRCPIYVPGQPTPIRRIFQDLSFWVASMLAVSWLLLKGARYDAVIAVTPSMTSLFTSYWYRFWRRGSRFVVRIMDMQAEAAGELGMLKPSPFLTWIVNMETWVLKKADWVCTLTPAMRNRILQRGVPWSRTSVFPLWVDFNRIGPVEPDPRLMEALGIPADRRLVLYSGAVGEKQGLEVILEIANRIRDEMPELLFMVCGSGPYVEILKKSAASMGAGNVVFLNLQPEPVFNQLLNRAWLHLVVQRQTKTESYLPSKLMNVMAVGGLVLVTAFPGTTLHSIVHENEAGMLVTEPHAEPMVRIIRLLRDNPAEAERLRNNARRFACENLGRDAVLREWAEGIGLF
jgi:colanic acid biosynthesis glycosyl transferase WcaI